MMVRVEIDDELLAQAEGSAKARGLSFRDFVAEALRVSISRGGSRATKKFTQKVHDFGIHIESPWTLLAEMETENDVGRNRR